MNPKPPACPAAYSSSSTLASSSSSSSVHPPSFTVARRCPRVRSIGLGERQLAVRQLATVRPCWWMSRTAPAVWRVCLAAAWEGRRLNNRGATRVALHPAALSCAPCGTVHTHTQPSTVPLQAES